MPNLTVPALQPSALAPALTLLRRSAMTCAAAGLLPLPAVAASDPANGAFVACLYFGVASAWLATEILRCGEAGELPVGQRARLLAVALAVGANTSVFIVMGLAAGVQTHIPFPLMALLSALPAVGLVPWLAARVRQPYGAILLAAVVCLAAKLTACIVARIVYGPDFLQLGYVAGDWETAKLMITLFWGLTTALSLAAFADGFARAR